MLLSNRLVDLDEILYGSDDTEAGIDTVLLNTVTWTIPKWRTFKHQRWVLFLNRLVDLDEILHGGDDIEDDLDYIKLKP
jgi:hypothetical protein